MGETPEAARLERVLVRHNGSVELPAAHLGRCQLCRIADSIHGMCWKDEIAVNLHPQIRVAVTDVAGKFLQLVGRCCLLHARLRVLDSESLVETLM